MSRIEYAALKYYNNIISEECLYIGMLYHNLTTGKRDFRYISNFGHYRPAQQRLPYPGRDPGPLFPAHRQARG